MNEPRSKTERNREIYRLRMEGGLTYRAIGERYGISVERVRNICWRMGVIERSEKIQREKSDDVDAFARDINVPGKMDQSAGQEGQACIGR